MTDKSDVSRKWMTTQHTQGEKPVHLHLAFLDDNVRAFKSLQNNKRTHRWKWRIPKWMRTQHTPYMYMPTRSLTFHEQIWRHNKHKMFMTTRYLILLRLPRPETVRSNKEYITGRTGEGASRESRGSRGAGVFASRRKSKWKKRQVRERDERDEV